MSVDNRLWGAPHIHGELLKLGFAVAQSTVAKYVWLDKLLAAGASKVLGLDAERTAHALAIAGVGAVSCAVIQAEPVSNWKGLASGEAASRALLNTYLARTGVTGTLGVFDGPHGIFQLVRVNPLVRIR
jgi:2-methylcitrate dehydratase PrpD